jgi:hypothetical protein
MADNPLLQDEPKPKVEGEVHPTPAQRADFVIKRLEQFIRDGRTIGEGMSLSRWQDMARAEITNALIEAEDDLQEDDAVSRRLLFTVASALITIGFWGALLAFEKAHYLIVAIICSISGIWLFAVIGEWRFQKYWRRRKALRRTKGLLRVEDLTKRIKKLEEALLKEAEALEDDLKSVAREASKENAEKLAETLGLRLGEEANKE